MATEKVGVYRKWHGATPTDDDGKPLPRDEWPRRRRFRWAVRWFGSDGRRYSRSFVSRKEANDFAEGRQAAIRVGRADEPSVVTLAEFARMYLDLRCGLAPTTRLQQGRTLRFLWERLGEARIVSTITALDARRFIAWYREREYRGRRPASATVNRIVRECRRIFQEAIACSVIRENPFKGVRQEKVGQKPWHQVTTVE